jgi:hypothetical protein
VIQKATPDGQHIESIIVDGLETADGIVVDSTGGKVAQKVYSYELSLLVLSRTYIIKYTISNLLKICVIFRNVSVVFHLFSVP